MLDPTPLADVAAGISLEVEIGQMILAGVEDETVSDDSRHIINDSTSATSSWWSAI
jgi:hypothetical protein